MQYYSLDVGKYIRVALLGAVWMYSWKRAVVVKMLCTYLLCELFRVRVDIRVSVSFSFSGRIRTSDDVQWVELQARFSTCRHSHYQNRFTFDWDKIKTKTSTFWDSVYNQGCSLIARRSRDRYRQLFRDWPVRFLPCDAAIYASAILGVVILSAWLSVCHTRAL